MMPFDASKPPKVRFILNVVPEYYGASKIDQIKSLRDCAFNSHYTSRSLGLKEAKDIVESLLKRRTSGISIIMDLHQYGYFTVALKDRLFTEKNVELLNNYGSVDLTGCE